MAATGTALEPIGIAKAGKVCLLTPSLDYGGAEVMIAALARWLTREGWDVVVISMLPPQAFVEELEMCGVRVRSLGMRSGATNVAGIAEFVKQLRTEDPDVVHAHMFHANVLARVLRPWLRVPLICTVHSVRESSRKRNTAWLRDWAYRLTDGACDRTTTVAEAATERYRRNGLARADRIQTIPNGVDTKRFRRDESARRTMREALGAGQAFVWLAVGRLELAKDYRSLLRAFAEVQGEGARLFIAGDGRLRPDVEVWRKEFGLEDTVTLLGTRGDVAELMNAADGYVMSSAWEGAPVVLLEAGASELPVVTTNAGGCAELVQDGVSARVVGIKDANALAGAMRVVMALSGEERARMGTAGRAFVEQRYSNDRVFARYAALYREVLCRA